MSYEIPSNLPQPTRFEADGSPTWVFADGEWTNRGWIVPLERLAEYIDPQEPPPPAGEPVPETIGPAQLRVALLRLHGIDAETLGATVGAIIASLPAEQQTEANYLWQYSTLVRRDNPLVGAVGYVLGLTTEQVDELYRVGNQI
jgi:hypothetical protein